MVFKATDNAVTAKYTVSLDEETVKRAREIGGGNLSLGIRTLVLQPSAVAPAATKRAIPKVTLNPREQKLKELGLVERDGSLYFKDGSRPSLTFKRQHGL